jgi:hypothetical protein
MIVVDVQVARSNLGGRCASACRPLNCIMTGHRLAMLEAIAQQWLLAIALNMINLTKHLSSWRYCCQLLVWCGAKWPSCWCSGLVA